MGKNQKTSTKNKLLDRFLAAKKKQSNKPNIKSDGVTMRDVYRHAFFYGEELTEKQEELLQRYLYIEKELYQRKTPAQVISQLITEKGLTRRTAQLSLEQAVQVIGDTQKIEKQVSIRMAIENYRRLADEASKDMELNAKDAWKIRLACLKEADILEGLYHKQEATVDPKLFRDPSKVQIVPRVDPAALRRYRDEKEAAAKQQDQNEPGTGAEEFLEGGGQ